MTKVKKNRNTLALPYLFWYNINMPYNKTIKVVFYKTLMGNEPVREWLLDLSPDKRKSIGEDIKAIEIAWPIGLPLVRKLDTNLWEVRTKLPNQISRVFFTIVQDMMVLLHAIIKKTQKTPQKDLELAKRRRNEVLEGDTYNGK